MFVLGPWPRQKFLRQSAFVLTLLAAFGVFLLVRQQWIWAGVVFLIAAYGTAVALRTIFGFAMINDEGVTTSKLIGRRFIAWNEITMITDCGYDWPVNSYRVVELTLERSPNRRRRRCVLPVPRKPYLGSDPHYDRSVARIHRAWVARTGQAKSGHPRRITRHFPRYAFPYTTEG